MKNTKWICKVHGRLGEYPTACIACVGLAMGKTLRKLDIKPTGPGWENFKWDEWKPEWESEIKKAFPEAYDDESKT